MQYSWWIKQWQAELIRTSHFLFPMVQQILVVLNGETLFVLILFINIICMKLINRLYKKLFVSKILNIKLLLFQRGLIDVMVFLDLVPKIMAPILLFQNLKEQVWFKEVWLVLAIHLLIEHLSISLQKMTFHIWFLVDLMRHK